MVRSGRGFGPSRTTREEDVMDIQRCKELANRILETHGVTGGVDGMFGVLLTKICALHETRNSTERAAVTEFVKEMLGEDAPEPPGVKIRVVWTITIPDDERLRGEREILAEGVLDDVRDVLKVVGGRVETTSIEEVKGDE